jgi:HEPN domain-containing protein
MTGKELIQHWKRSAKEEYDAAEILHRGKRFTQALFHCHLAVEKMLKAQYMLEHDEDPPYSHNLVVVARKLKRKWTEQEEQELGELSHYCEQSRYGDELWIESIATEETAKRWLDRCKYFLSLFV